jgi:hypothetical protein
MPKRRTLQVIDNRPIQVFVAKPGKNPTGRAVPVQRMLAIFKPLQVREFSRRIALGGSVIQHGLSYDSLEPPTFPVRRLFPKPFERNKLDGVKPRLGLAIPGFVVFIF